LKYPEREKGFLFALKAPGYPLMETLGTLFPFAVLMKKGDHGEIF